MSAIICGQGRQACAGLQGVCRVHTLTVCFPHLGAEQVSLLLPSSSATKAAFPAVLTRLNIMPLTDILQYGMFGDCAICHQQCGILCVLSPALECAVGAYFPLVTDLPTRAFLSSYGTALN